MELHTFSYNSYDKNYSNEIHIIYVVGLVNVIVANNFVILMREVSWCLGLGLCLVEDLVVISLIFTN